jgi:hypothetical protein
MSLEASKEARKQKALENLKKGRELRAKKLAEQKKEPVVDEMSELDETPKQETPKPIKKPRVKKVVEPVVETPKIDPPPPPPPIDTPVVKPKKQYKPREPKPPKVVEVERVVERVVYAAPPLDIQFY